ncbi:MAG: hypothetical protein WAV51_00745 [Microgenomates group bacterium]
MSFALVISRVFEPLVLFIFILVMVFVRAKLPLATALWQGGIILFVIILPPILLLIRALKQKKISNWDMSDRKQRVGALVVFLGFFAFGIFLLSLFREPVITNFFLYMFGVFLLFFLVTLRYKMSGHLTGAAIWVFSVSSWFGWYTTLLFMILPLLAWSRVTLKRHTLGQVLLGTVFGCVCGYIGIRFGYIPHY